MKIKMKASQRRLAAMGLTLLEKQTKAASRECGKAFLSTTEASVQLGRIVAGREALPVSDAAAEVWNAEEPIVVAYRDALFMVAVELNKTLEREKEFENDDAANATREQMDEVTSLLRELGDQRDLFTEEEEGESSDLFATAGAGAGRE